MIKSRKEKNIVEKQDVHSIHAIFFKCNDVFDQLRQLLHHMDHYMNHYSKILKIALSTLTIIQYLHKWELFPLNEDYSKICDDFLIHQVIHLYLVKK